MRFLADESCDFAAVRTLRAAGHDVVTVAETAPSAEDEAVVGLALREQRILLTEDRDFGRILFAQGAESVGVIYLRFPASTRSELGPSVVRLVERLGDRLHGTFVVLQPGRARISSGISKE